MAQPVAIRAEGLADLRRDLKAIDKKLPRELNKAQRKALEPVRAKAAQKAPHRSGVLAASIRPFTTTKGAGLRSPLPYAQVQHWGGRVGRNKATRIKGRPFIWDAIRDDLDRVTEELGDAIDEVARHHGFR